NVATFMQNSLEKMMVQSDSNLGIIIGVATLVFTSTTIFVDIQDSINAIWGVKPKPKKSWLKLILDRLISLSMVLGLGFLLITSLLVNSFIMLFTNYINEIIPGITVNMLNWINTALLFWLSPLFLVLFSKFYPMPKSEIRT